MSAPAWWLRLSARLRRRSPQPNPPKSGDVPRLRAAQLDPLEPPEGQDPDPPDLLLTMIVTLTLLSDVRDLLEREHDDANNDPARPDVLLRIAAVSSVLRRHRARLEGGAT